MSWQGWGDSRVRMRDALAAAPELRKRSIIGFDEFLKTCTSRQNTNDIVVPPFAISRLARRNVDLLTLDTDTRTVSRWMGWRLPEDFGASSIKSNFLRDVYTAYHETVPRAQHAPVLATVRAALTGMLRRGAEPLTVQSAADSIGDELRSTAYACIMFPRLRMGFRLLAVSLVFTAVFAVTSHAKPAMRALSTVALIVAKTMALIMALAAAATCLSGKRFFRLAAALRYLWPPIVLMGCASL